MQHPNTAGLTGDSLFWKILYGIVALATAYLAITFIYGAIHFGLDYAWAGTILMTYVTLKIASDIFGYDKILCWIFGHKVRKDADVYPTGHSTVIYCARCNRRVEEKTHG